MNLNQDQQTKNVKIGVFMSAKAIHNIYIKQKSKFEVRELIRANNGIKTDLFFFSQMDVNLEQLTINGVYFDGQLKKWKREVYPYPDVLYSRTREIDNNLNMKLRESFIKKGVFFLNVRSAFDKWNIHQELLKDQEVSQHLPFTMLYNDPSDLRKMFSYHRSVYIKPRVGRLGHHIIHVRMVPGQGYEYKYFTKRLVYRKVKTYTELTKVIKKILSGKSAIMQAAIDSIRLKDNKMVDMRAELQRGGNGELKVVDIFSRIGAKNSPITNLPSGAKLFCFDPFIRSHLNYSEEEVELIKQKIDVFLKKSHESIEKVYGCLGETAIDFALDSNQQLWFIECNSTSTKLAYLVARSPQKTIKNAFINPLEYCIYLYNKHNMATSNTPIQKESDILPNGNKDDELGLVEKGIETELNVNKFDEVRERKSDDINKTEKEQTLNTHLGNTVDDSERELNNEKQKLVSKARHLSLFARIYLFIKLIRKQKI